jgi:quercetin dioxygenase-like cupin family protein
MRLAAIFLALCAVCAGQVSTPIPDNEVPQRKEILQNHRVTVSLLELALDEATPMHRHEHDIIAVFVNGGSAQNTGLGQKPSIEKIPVGEVRYRAAGYAHALKNQGTEALRAVIINFADPQGKMEPVGTSSHTCNVGSTTACYDEHNLFCTDRVCVEDVTIAPGAVTHKHSHSTDHMLVAVSDYELSDEVEGKGTIIRSRKSGEIEYLTAGITHQQTNIAKTPARFIVIAWR